MTKYQEYRLKASQLDYVLAFLAAPHKSVDTLTIAGERYRLTKAHDGRAVTIEPMGAP